MPLPRWLASVNRRATNRVLGLAAPRLPGFAVVVHTGRRSGRTFRTPVNLFADGDGYAVALTYGSGSDWVRNVLAADGAELIRRGRRERVVEPRVVRDEARTRVPAPLRPILAALGVCDFLLLRPAQP